MTPIEKANEIVEQFKNKKPENGDIIVFKAVGYELPEIGIYQIHKSTSGDMVEVYIPANDETESIDNIKWWMVIQS